jgi:hypothetical protein
VPAQPSLQRAAVNAPLFQKCESRAAFALILALSLGLYAQQVAHPTVLFDDFEFIRDSLTWQSTIHNLLIPHNEHMSPIARLVTFAFWKLGGLAHVGIYCAIFSQMILVGDLALLYRLLRVEGLDEGAALAGTAIFGVTQVYYEAIAWYSASLSSLALLFILAGLLTIAGRQGWRCWLAVNIYAVLAMCSFSNGILAAAFFPIYAWMRADVGIVGVGKILVRTLPGIAIYMGLYFLFARPHMEHLDIYNGGSVYQSFHPWSALGNTGRALVDVTLMGNLGGQGHFFTAHWRRTFFATLTIVLMVAAIWTTLRRQRLPALALWFLTLNLLLIYSFRNLIAYESTIRWGRYHLFSQVGISILVAMWLGKRKFMLGMAGIRWAAALGLCLFALRLFSPFSLFHQADYYAPEQSVQFATYQKLFDAAREAGVKREMLDGRLPVPIAGLTPTNFVLEQLYVPPVNARGDVIDFVAATEPLQMSIPELGSLPGFSSELALANQRLEKELQPFAVGSPSAILKCENVSGMSEMPGQPGEYKITSADGYATFVVPGGTSHYLFMNFRLEPVPATPVMSKLAWSYDGVFKPADEITFQVSSGDFAAIWNLSAVPGMDVPKVTALRFYPGQPGGTLRVRRFCVQR